LVLRHADCRKAINEFLCRHFYKLRLFHGFRTLNLAKASRPT
jgi:hypothetical protein